LAAGRVNPDMSGFVEICKRGILMEALKMTRVSRGYDGGDVLENLDFSLAEGAFEALMGPSGCGKSTFLHIAAGLISASSGTVSIGGNDITTMNDSMLSRFRRRHVGVVFQDFNLLPGKTVREDGFFL
jgi:putative ABC transport system ATP-binding protein